MNIRTNVKIYMYRDGNRLTPPPLAGFSVTLRFPPLLDYIWVPSAGLR